MDLGAPIVYLALEPGTDVFGSDGERVGALRHVLAADDKDVFDGLVIDVRRGPGGLRFVDADQVGDLHERGVVLRLASADVDALPEPTGGPAVVDSGAELDSGLQAKLRRAWDLISGKY
jgi:hypothetical protein